MRLGEVPSLPEMPPPDRGPTVGTLAGHVAVRNAAVKTLTAASAAEDLAVGCGRRSHAPLRGSTGASLATRADLRRPGRGAARRARSALDSRPRRAPAGRPSPRPRTRGRADGDPGLGRPLGAYGVGWRRCQEFTDGGDGGCGRAGGDWGGLVEQPVGSTGSRVSGFLRRIAMIPPVVVLDAGVAQLAISGVARGLLGQQEAALGGGPEGGIREGRACCVARAACLRTRRRRTVPAIAVRIRTRRRRTAPGVGTVRAAPGGGRRATDERKALWRAQQLASAARAECGD